MKIPDLRGTWANTLLAACFVIVAAASGGQALAQAQAEPSSSGVPATQPPAVPAPLPAAVPAPLPVAVPAPLPAAVPAPQAAAPGDPPVVIYMPDGQRSSHALVIHVTGDITIGQNPRLQLLRSKSLLMTAAANAAPLVPAVVAPDQTWSQVVEGQRLARSGTILLFDVSTVDFGWKPMLRVRPVVSWTRNGVDRTVVGEREVNVAHIGNTVGMTAAIVGAALLVVIGLSWRAAGNPLRLLIGAYGRLSLAQSQIALWTVVIGGVVLGYGMVRLEIPEIPASLLALMGASLATGGVAYYKDAKNPRSTVKAQDGAAPVTLALADLVRDLSSPKSEELSLAKAQMLFWTLLLVVLFVSKSILEGAIWEVPWPLVALMGFSQAGYVTPKLVQE